MYTETETSTALASRVAAAQAAEDFLQRTCDIVDAGAQAVMISIGHRSGLFDVMSGLEPATSQQIADRAGLAERYPQSRFTGYDLCGDGIADAGRAAAARDLGNVRFETLDMTDFDERGRYDFITSFQ